MRIIDQSVKYGRIQIRLKDQMDARGISRNALATALGVRFEVIDKWYNNAPITRLDTDILAKLCYALRCDVSDIIEYAPD